MMTMMMMMLMTSAMIPRTGSNYFLNRNFQSALYEVKKKKQLVATQEGNITNVDRKIA